MLKSKSSLLQSIRPTTFINTGKSTNGFDKMVAMQPKQKLELFERMSESKLGDWLLSPVKRVDIRKPEGRQTSLGIPAIRDRIWQAVVKNAV